MKIQHKASAVLERTSDYLKSRVLQQKPAWYDIVGANPPAVDLSKRAKALHAKTQAQDPREALHTRTDGVFKTRSSGEDRKQKNNSIALIPKLQFVEDQLRDVFYHQHPWEFARPKTLVENSGNEQDKCDWSRLLQFNRPLDGESVVQRTLWLLKAAKEAGEPKTLFDAYDQARFEFYKLRMAEEMNSAVSKEESSMFGAIYPSTNLQWGLQKEQEVIDVWAKVAEVQTKVKEAGKNKGAASASMGVSDTKESSTSVWETTFVEEA